MDKGLNSGTTLPQVRQTMNFSAELANDGMTPSDFRVSFSPVNQAFLV